MIQRPKTVLLSEQFIPALVSLAQRRTSQKDTFFFTFKTERPYERCRHAMIWPILTAKAAHCLLTFLSCPAL